MAMAWEWGLKSGWAALTPCQQISLWRRISVSDSGMLSCSGRWNRCLRYWISSFMKRNISWPMASGCHCIQQVSLSWQ